MVQKDLNDLFWILTSLFFGQWPAIWDLDEKCLKRNILTPIYVKYDNLSNKGLLSRFLVYQALYLVWFWYSTWTIQKWKFQHTKMGARYDNLYTIFQFIHHFSIIHHFSFIWTHGMVVLQVALSSATWDRFSQGA